MLLNLPIGNAIQKLHKCSKDQSILDQKTERVLMKQDKKHGIIRACSKTKKKQDRA
jgi:hypothetical protein